MTFPSGAGSVAGGIPRPWPRRPSLSGAVRYGRRTARPGAVCPAGAVPCWLVQPPDGLVMVFLRRRLVVLRTTGSTTRAATGPRIAMIST